MSLRTSETPVGEGEPAGPTSVEKESDRTQGKESVSEGGLEESDIFDILRNSRRRIVLSHLLREEQASVGELTERVATKEYDTTAVELSSDQYKRVYTGLYQCHLPRLEKFDVVDIDKDEKQVTLLERGYEVESYLDPSGDSERAAVEVGVAIVVAVAVVLGIAGVSPFGSVPVLGWSMLTVFTLVGLGLFRLAN